MDFNEFKACMARSGYSIPKLAKEIDMSKTALYNKAKGISEFTLEDIQKIARVLNMTKNQILIVFFAEKVS